MVLRAVDKPATIELSGQFIIISARAGFYLSWPDAMLPEMTSERNEAGRLPRGKAETIAAKMRLLGLSATVESATEPEAGRDE